jgi:hypothetical protein
MNFKKNIERIVCLLIKIIDGGYVDSIIFDKFYNQYRELNAEELGKIVTMCEVDEKKRESSLRTFDKFITCTIPMMLAIGVLGQNLLLKGTENGNNSYIIESINAIFDYYCNVIISIGFGFLVIIIYFPLSLSVNQIKLEVAKHYLNKFKNKK